MASSLVFTARRREPSLVDPAEPTPHEFETLSDIDDQDGFRFYVLCIHFYAKNPSMAGHDPATTIRSALSKALVFYYPIAGRLIQSPTGKLVVDCTGEGVLFVEADADITLQQFGSPPQAPFPCLDELIYGADEPPRAVLALPLLWVQVTRLKCGGFVLGYRFNHTMVDAAGTVQFMKAVAELARGAGSPTVAPVWARERLLARDPPRVTHTHLEYDAVAPETAATVTGEKVLRSFFFGPREMVVLRRALPPRLRGCTRFEVLTAFLWRCRTIALGGDGDVRLTWAVNARDKCSPPLPAGFYGNATAFPVVRAAAEELRRRPLGYAVELVREGKASITEGYMESSVDFQVVMGRPVLNHARLFIVTDVSRAGFDEVDFGWGAPVYAGSAVAGGLVVPRNACHYARCRGWDGVFAAIPLPAPAMERFVVEMQRILEEPPAAEGESNFRPKRRALL